MGILKQLMAAQKEEEDRKANYAEIVAAKKEDIATLTATIETKLARQGDLAVEVESLKNDVADMQRSLAADQELTAKLAESGSGQSSEWEERQESRTGAAPLAWMGQQDDRGHCDDGWMTTRRKGHEPRDACDVLIPILRGKCGRVDAAHLRQRPRNVA